EVGGHEALQRPVPEGPLAHHRLGDDAPSEPFGEQVGGQLPPVETVGEVPQGPLAPLRLVDGPVLDALQADTDEERPVRAPGQAALNLDLSLGEEGQRSRRLCPFIRTHTCPSGSRGSPHSGQGGRPAWTTGAAWRARAADWSRVAPVRA